MEEESARHAIAMKREEKKKKKRMAKKKELHNSSAREHVTRTNFCPPELAPMAEEETPSTTPGKSRRTQSIIGKLKSATKSKKKKKMKKNKSKT